MEKRPLVKAFFKINANFKYCVNIWKYKHLFIPEVWLVIKETGIVLIKVQYHKANITEIIKYIELPDVSKI